VGFIDLKTGTVRYVHAGHTCPVLFGNSEPVFIKQKRQMFIGGVPDVRYEGQEFVMKPGDALFLYTDGVTEAEQEDGTQYGNERLLSVLSGMKEAFNESGDKEFCRFVCRNVVADVHSFTGDIPQSDDITVLCVKYR
jgi:sigma-B regulation protein RsbU (phosphoserine phosphatase)